MGIFSKKLLKPNEEDLIAEAIREAELKTSGEIRVHINRWCKGDPKLKAANQFYHLHMERTIERNGVLIYVALEEHKFAIIGDQGIHEKVGDDFWSNVANVMQSSFKEGKLVEGIVFGIHEAGESLAEFFPRKDNDVNELPDDISYG